MPYQADKQMQRPSERPLHLLIAGDHVLLWIDDRTCNDLIHVANGKDDIGNAARCQLRRRALCINHLLPVLIDAW